ncbi:MAG: hypothetical protein AAGJ18_26545 [Bacteroidota bacterium]
MRNIVGQPVSGKDYFLRKTITKLIYRRLDAGSNLFMAAPRRVGKTSIMYHLRDEPKTGYSFIYIPTESIDDTQLYFRRLFESLLNSEVVSKKVKASEKAKSIFETITEKVKKIGAYGVEVELHEKETEQYSDIFLELVKKLGESDIRIIVMVDEFPSTVENIKQKNGKIAAVQFLKLNRTIRQESAGGIQFIYTGSIGLPAIVNRLDSPESINDLNQVEIPPLSLVDGKRFTQTLLDAAKVPYEPEAIDYLLQKINWLMPFFIQLSVQELVDLFDQNETTITKKIVDLAFQRICNRRNNIHFDSYYNRLKDTFSSEDYSLALDILNLIAVENKIAKRQLLQKLGKDKEQRHLNSVVESLEYDGYINLANQSYTFNSPILQLWWNKYIRD